MKIQESAENYLETIFVLHQQKGQVRSIDIANELSFSKPSVSNAMRQFRLEGYITVDINGYISLTKKGLAIAERVYERHQFITQYLISLGVSESTAKEDACRMEHILSDETFEKIKSHYGNKGSIK